ncbi:SPT3 Dosage dependent suppressor of Ty-induced promoter mutations-like protein [Dissophora globulifera]|nr:SPT3 Dosage dependent suppressor of Ty-induced promoter mutations-like protein [Dissophora globulifera]
MSLNVPSSAQRLNVKTHVFKKELQEYIPTQIEDRLRIETIIYVELSIVDQSNALVNAYDYARLPKELFFSQPDKVMAPEEMATKRIIDIAATLQCPSKGWKEEKEACLRCARRMSTKLDQTESRIMHMLPELHRTENGDALISFRSGVANIQFKINCYCGHQKEKEGFVIRFDSQSDAAIASHVTLPLMFYHQNKNRVASRALAAAAKAQAKSEPQQQQSVEQTSATRNIVKSVSSKTKREARSRLGNSPIGNQHQLPSPANSLLDSPASSLLDSPVEWSSSPEMNDFIDSSDIPFTVPSPPPPDPLISLFPESATQEQQQQQQSTIALITHMTPSSGPLRGGSLVTIHGAGFSVGEVMYVCFGENMVPIIPQRDHMLECITPASNKAGTVPVFAMNAIESNIAQATFTYVDDNEKELIKLALQRMINISTRMEGPLDNVLQRANEFALWGELLETDVDASASPSGSNSYANLEKMVLESFQILDTPTTQSVEGLSITNHTGHTMLHLAVTLQFEELAKDLLVRRVDTAIQDKNGFSALDWAVRLKNQFMIDLLSGAVASAGSVSTPVSDKLTCTSEHDEAARGLPSSVSPGSRPTATDQPDVDPGHGGIADQTGVQLEKLANYGLALDLRGHVEPQMDVEWEGFGQGPGDDIAGQRHMEGTFTEAQHDHDFFMRPAQNDSPPPVGIATVQQDSKRLAIHQHQSSSNVQYTKTLSAIPVNDSDSDNMMAMEGVVKLGQAGSLTDGREQNLGIENLAFTNCSMDGLDSARQPVGDLDRIAPIGQDLAASAGCTDRMDAGLPAQVDGTGQQSSGVHGSGCIQSIQSTALLDGVPKDVQTSTAQVDVVTLQQQQQTHSQFYASDQQHHEQVMQENSVLTIQKGQVVVDAVVEVANTVGRSHDSAAKQAVVQSSRNDVESEPLLFLGGLPVALSPRPVRTASTAVSSTSNANRVSADATQSPLDGDEDSVKP